MAKGYQYLENDFFELCKTRKLRPVPMLLYIYLRGLYCRFQGPEFYWPDKVTREHLGIVKNTLKSARNHLQERGMIKFIPGVGKSPTKYTMIGNVLLPDFRGSKSDTLKARGSNNDPQRVKNFRLEGQNISSSIIKSKERDKKDIVSPDQKPERWAKRPEEIDKMIEEIIRK